MDQRTPAIHQYGLWGINASRQGQLRDTSPEAIANRPQAVLEADSV